MATIINCVHFTLTAAVQIKNMKDEYPNKITESDIQRFTPDKLCGCEYICRHSDDCRQEGCPRHTAKLSYNSVCDIYSIDFGDGQKVVLDSNQIDIINDWILRLKI